MFFRNLVRASVTPVMDWEAGENPALPRNCKRAKLLATVHSHGKAAAAVGLTPDSPSQETGANATTTPFA